MYNITMRINYFKFASLIIYPYLVLNGACILNKDCLNFDLTKKKKKRKKFRYFIPLDFIFESSVETEHLSQHARIKN
jgi:hypothetical protein